MNGLDSTACWTPTSERPVTGKHSIDHEVVRLNKNDIVEITIEDMSDEGLGIGHAEGMALFVKDAVV